MNRKERRAAARRGGADMPRRRDGDGLFQLGLAALQSGEPEAASGWFAQALTSDARVPEWHFYRAVAAQMCRRLGEAETHYRRAVALRPGFAEALASLGGLLAELGRFEEAVTLFRRAAALRPQDAGIRAGLGRVLLACGPQAPQSEQERRLLGDTVLQMRREPVGRLPEVVVSAIGVLKAHPVLGAAIRRAAELWPQHLPTDQVLESPVVAAMAEDPVLAHLLRSGPVADVELEQYLTGFRAILLERVDSGAEPTGPDLLKVAAAVATQCFINEYVFGVTSAEAAQVARLRDRLGERLAAGTDLPPLWLAALAAYQPLHAITGASRLLDRTWPQSIHGLLVQQITEPAEERRISETIQRLTPITDAVSQRVQRQYEENPYPRWVEAMAVAAPATLDEHLRMKFAASAFRPLGKGREIDILVAGCGSGQHAIDVARQFPGARLLAVDLSLVSLAYARRKTQELDLAGIEYGQADILELGALARRFDLIVAMGVLHHLADPFAGWRVLVSLLRADGVMNIGLYSEAARADVVAARAAIAEKGYGTGPDDIRNFRQEIMGLDPASPLKALTRYGDFFATSDCRDLLFHVEEHRLTLPAIKAFVAEQRLAFLGFDLDPRSLQGYAAANPEDVTMTDLDRWHEFEQRHPQTFRGMYQFWVQQRT